MSGKNDDIAGAVFGFGFGVWSFFWGFTRLRRKRLIENTPTSTIRGLAMGLVEIIGKADRAKALKGPFTNADCAYYCYTVERYERRGKSSSWVTIAKGDSSCSPFWVEDETGKIQVFPNKAETILNKDFEFTTGWGRDLPGNLIAFMESNRISWQSFFGTQTLRFREWDILSGEQTYVLGTAGKNQELVKEHNDRCYQRLMELKSRPDFEKIADTNQDGFISDAEWDAVSAKVEQDVLDEELKSGQVQNLDVIISKGDNKQVFLISDESQKDLEAKLSWQSFGGVFGGAALTLLCLAYLIWRFHYSGY